MEVSSRRLFSAVIYLISNHELVKSLAPSPDEVGAIWSMPLEYCLTAQWKEEWGTLAERGGPDWPYEEEIYVGSSGVQSVQSLKGLLESHGHGLVENVGLPDEPLPYHPYADGTLNS